MASMRGEAVGETVGYRVRLESKVSNRTRIELVTEGVFTRMVLDDPGLDGVAAILFDEFHERSLEADLALALALDVKGALRPDLRLLVMSATLEATRIAGHLGDVPVIESAGRAFPVETRHPGRDPARRIEDEVAGAVRKALAEEPGSVLVFLPGMGEIARTAERLDGHLPADVDLTPLYGALSPAEQDRAISPAPAGRRKVVLATAIAETSLTIEGVRVVVDCGLARVPRYEPASGLTRLETVRVTRAAADQRRGRAGRTGPGVCYRLWDEAQTRALVAHGRPEILDADLASLVLDLAAWGVRTPDGLRFVDPPPRAAFEEAVALLKDLDALDGDGAITPEGEALRRLPLPPRLAHMVHRAAAAGRGRLAAEIAVVLTERGTGGTSADLRDRVTGLRRDRGKRGETLKGLARRWAALAGGAEGDDDVEHCGATVALAYPDRIARARGRDGTFVLANGRGARLDVADRLATEPFLAVAELQGGGADARILLAAPIGRDEIEADFAAHIIVEDDVRFEPAAKAVRARRRRRLGRLVLAEEVLTDPDAEAVAAALVGGIRSLGIECLPWTKSLRQWRGRVAFIAEHANGDRDGGDWPDLSDAALTETFEHWLLPFIAGKRSIAEISADDLRQAIEGLVPWRLAHDIDRLTPSHFEVPTGSRIAIDYDAPGGPALAVRVQELFGLDSHPAIVDGKVPLTLELLSPAHRPVQVTRDLPGFWRGSYQAVKTEMKGRYPKHPWPDDPLAAPPTRRAKPRGT